MNRSWGPHPIQEASMHAGSRVSRRHGLAMGVIAAAGTFVDSARAQVAKRIERYAPELDAIVSTSEPIRELASGTGGPGGPTEGPVWFSEAGYLLYSDIFNDRRMKYVPGRGSTVFKEKTARGNGMTRELK